MDAARFDTLTRSLTGGGSSRRRLLTGLAGSALGVVATALRIEDTHASHFGCRHWKDDCRRNSQCCSGLCRGPKGKKTCRAHNRGGCALADNFCAGGEDNRCGGGSCICNITTGKAPHCGGTVFCPAVECQRDADCGEPGAACIAVAGCQGCGSPATQNFCQRPCAT
jgi:hypothetical protein